MRKEVVLVSYNCNLLNGFRLLFSSACKVHLYSDLTEFCSAGNLCQFDYILIDACFSEQLRRCDGFLSILGSDRFFFITDRNDVVLDEAFSRHALLSFPQDIPMLFCAADDEKRAFEESVCQLRSSFVGVSPAAEEIRRQIVHMAAIDAPVLITGETGAGKGVAAELIHRLSPRGNRDIVSVNMTTLQEGLAAGELFGTVKGAFTDAVTHKGFFEAAMGSSLFLDEIGDLKPDLQAKLLHVIECGSFRSIGSPAEKHTDARLIFATNANLQEKMAKNEFRSDFYYRISHFLIKIPPLRERKMDILPLARHFLSAKDKFIAPEAEAMLVSFDWPGNVRQLRHCLERASSLCGEGWIEARHVVFD